ncbi:MAG: hypothetical protein PHX43_00235 [Alphaproteobacteria bacterium]|nr:hypothetical protein [Alphaproteobacteria bacterium]
MQRLKTALEALDEMISQLEDKVELEASNRKVVLKKQLEVAKSSRNRETGAIAAAQKVAARLDHTISHVERVLRD